MSQINLSATGGAPTRSTRSATRAAAPAITRGSARKVPRRRRSEPPGPDRVANAINYMYMQNASAGDALKVRMVAVPVTTTPTFAAGTP